MTTTSQPDPVRLFLDQFTTSLAERTLVRLALSRPVQADNTATKVLGRAIELKGVTHLSLTFRHAARDVTKNLPAPEAAEWLRAQLGVEYRSALLGTTRRDWQFISSEDGAARVVDHQPAIAQPPPRQHDEPKHGLLDASAQDWLRGLGLLDADGKVRASLSDKHRQINRYLEILGHLADDCGWTCGGELTLADMGCGKGYLTFGAWHLFHRARGRRVRLIGVEARKDLVETTSRLARQIRADGLEFLHGDIASTPLPRVDALIALHACNTATDDALRRGIELGARLILVAPCCHQDLRPQLVPPAPLAPVFRHGVMAERLAEWATDGLRALHLEWAGYRTKIFEFISTEHTAKNLMIAAVRTGEPFTDGAARERLAMLRAFFGLREEGVEALKR